MSLNKPVIPNQAQPIVDNTGNMEDHFRYWVQQVNQQMLIVGTGSPEGQVEATQYSLYIDEATPTSPVQYRKMLVQIASDRSKGWVVV